MVSRKHTQDFAGFSSLFMILQWLVQGLDLPAFFFFPHKRADDNTIESSIIAPSYLPLVLMPYYSTARTLLGQVFRREGRRPLPVQGQRTDDRLPLQCCPHSLTPKNLSSPGPRKKKSVFPSSSSSCTTQLRRTCVCGQGIRKKGDGRRECAINSS